MSAESKAREVGESVVDATPKFDSAPEWTSRVLEERITPGGMEPGDRIGLKSDLQKEFGVADLYFGHSPEAAGERRSGDPPTLTQGPLIEALPRVPSSLEVPNGVMRNDLGDGEYAKRVLGASRRFFSAVPERMAGSSR